MLRLAILGALLSTQTMAMDLPLPRLQWMVIDDTVMGGISNSKLLLQSRALLFTGEVSLENNGGFASFRAPFEFQQNNVHQLVVKVKGDGKQYQLRLRVDDYWDGPAFVHNFQTSEGKEQELVLTAKDFDLMFRGRYLNSPKPFTFGDVRSIGFMIAGKQAGNFQLQIQKISAMQSI